MKIICAGFPKTGTKSLALALRQLGYESLHDFEDHYELNLDHYLDFFEGRVDGTVFKKLYDDVDVVIGQPASTLWHILLQQFPDAKVILMVRDSADAWCKSKDDMMTYYRDNIQPWYHPIAPYISATQGKLARINSQNLILSTGQDYYYKMHKGTKCFDLMKSQYTRHNAAVKAIVPGDNFLEFNVKEGWGPLCRFLDVPVPNGPFPHENKKGSDVKQTSPIVDKMTNFSIYQRANKEARKSLLLLMALAVLIMGGLFQLVLFS